jgi:hypothetical protein
MCFLLSVSAKYEAARNEDGKLSNVKVSRLHR